MIIDPTNPTMAIRTFAAKPGEPVPCPKCERKAMRPTRIAVAPREIFGIDVPLGNFLNREGLLEIPALACDCGEAFAVDSAHIERIETAAGVGLLGKMDAGRDLTPDETEFLRNVLRGRLAKLENQHFGSDTNPTGDQN